MFFEISKIAWWLIMPSHLLPLAMAVGLLFLFLKWKRTGWWLLGLASTCFLLASIAPVTFVLLHSLEMQEPAPKRLPEVVDGIVLLNVGGETVREIMSLARRYPNAKLAVSGGRGGLADAAMTEAGEFKSIAAAQGVDPRRLFLEDRARNTYENAEFTRNLARPEPGERWVLITTAHHMPRALGAFRKAGWNVIPNPVDRTPPPENWLPGAYGISILDLVVYERVGYAVYWMTGRI